MTTYRNPSMTPVPPKMAFTLTDLPTSVLSNVFGHLRKDDLKDAAKFFYCAKDMQETLAHYREHMCDQGRKLAELTQNTGKLRQTITEVLTTMMEYHEMIKWSLNTLQGTLSVRFEENTILFVFSDRAQHDKVIKQMHNVPGAQSITVDPEFSLRMSDTGCIFTPWYQPNELVFTKGTTDAFISHAAEALMHMVFDHKAVFDAQGDLIATTPPPKATLLIMVDPLEMEDAQGLIWSVASTLQEALPHHSAVWDVMHYQTYMRYLATYGSS